MVNHIGVRMDGVPTLAELLFFDRIVVLSPPTANTSTVNNLLRSPPFIMFNRPSIHFSKEQIERFQRLRDLRLVVDLSEIENGPHIESHFKELMLHAFRELLNVVDVFHETNGEPTKEQRDQMLDDHPWLQSDSIEVAYDELFFKNLRQLISESTGNVVTSIISNRATASSAPHLAPSRFERHDILQVVLKAFPVPEQLTPLEKIQAFRQDEEAGRQLRRLRRLMGELSTKHTNAFDAEEELTSLVDAYAECLRRHRISCAMKVVSFLLISENSILRRLLQREPGKAFSKMLQLRSLLFSLSESERQFPGREAAYIVESDALFAK